MNTQILVPRHSTQQSQHPFQLSKSLTHLPSTNVTLLTSECQQQPFLQPSNIVSVSRSPTHLHCMLRTNQWCTGNCWWRRRGCHSRRGRWRRVDSRCWCCYLMSSPSRRDWLELLGSHLVHKVLVICWIVIVVEVVRRSWSTLCLRICYFAWTHKLDPIEMILPTWLSSLACICTGQAHFASARRITKPKSVTHPS